MLINIASLNVRTLYPNPMHNAPSPDYPPIEQPDREDDESIEDYIEKKVTEKIELIHTYLEIAVQNDARQGECLFFTLPEFFWNISWYSLRELSEINYITEYYMDNLSDIVKSIILKYPEESCGKIVFLSGTVGTLVNIENNLFDAINYLLCVDNFNLPSDGDVNISMWPKRGNAYNDYGEGFDQENGKIYYYVGERNHTFSIGIIDTSDVAAEHSSEEYGPTFNNDVLPGIPFVISICADYSNDYEFRQDEIKNKDSILHFLIACGMQLNPQHNYGSSVQFTIRNDGFTGDLYYPKAGGVQVRPVSNGYMYGDDLTPLLTIPFGEVRESFVLHEIDIVT